MSVTVPNLLYCMSNEQHDINSATPGIDATMHDYFNQHSFTRRPNDQTLATLSTVEHLFFIFGETNEKYRYIYTFANVAEQDFSFARLKYGFKRMYLIANALQEQSLRDIATALVSENVPRHKLEQQDVDDLSAKYIKHLQTICGLPS